MPPTITLWVPAPLRHQSEGQARLRLEADDVQGLLDELERRLPTLHRSVCDETGSVRRHVNLFVNEDHLRDRDGLGTALATGDLVTILPAVSGG